MVDIGLVDGDPESREAVRTALALKGHHLLVAETAKAGAAMLRDGEADLIIVSSALPDGSGLAFCRALREDGAHGETPVLIISDRGDIRSIEAAFRSGADDCLARPVKRAVLYGKVRKLLRGDAEENVSATVSVGLAAAYERLAEQGRRLGDVAEVFPGIATGDNRRLVAEDARGPNWRPVLMERHVTDPFRIEFTGEHVCYEPRRLLRTPPYELMREEKVVVRRSGPPVVAAVDRLGMLVEMTVYGVAPASGLLPDYVAAVLNSRVMDYYIRRVHPPPSGGSPLSLLRQSDLESMPIIIPGRSEQRALADVVSALEETAARPQSDERSERIRELRRAMNRAVFDIFGFTEDEVNRLGELHF